VTFKWRLESLRYRYCVPAEFSNGEWTNVDLEKVIEVVYFGLLEKNIGRASICEITPTTLVLFQIHYCSEQTIFVRGSEYEMRDLLQLILLKIRWEKEFGDQVSGDTGTSIERFRRVVGDDLVSRVTVSSDKMQQMAVLIGQNGRESYRVSYSHMMALFMFLGLTDDEMSSFYEMYYNYGQGKNLIPLVMWKIDEPDISLELLHELMTAV